MKVLEKKKTNYWKSLHFPQSNAFEVFVTDHPKKGDPISRVGQARRVIPCEVREMQKQKKPKQCQVQKLTKFAKNSKLGKN